MYRRIVAVVTCLGIASCLAGCVGNDGMQCDTTAIVAKLAATGGGELVFENFNDGDGGATGGVHAGLDGVIGIEDLFAIPWEANLDLGFRQKADVKKPIITRTTIRVKGYLDVEGGGAAGNAGD